jgi:hypothetical protein
MEERSIRCVEYNISALSFEIGKGMFRVIGFWLDILTKDKSEEFVFSIYYIDVLDIF